MILLGPRPIHRGRLYRIADDTIVADSPGIYEEVFDTIDHPADVPVGTQLVATSVDADRSVVDREIAAFEEFAHVVNVKVRNSAEYGIRLVK